MMTMNANRRLEEFILKLSTRQNDHGLFDKVNEIERKSKFNDIPISKHNSDNKICNKYYCNINNK
jgi:hypothetical protein